MTHLIVTVHFKDGSWYERRIELKGSLLYPIEEILRFVREVEEIRQKANIKNDVVTNVNIAFKK